MSELAITRKSSLNRHSLVFSVVVPCFHEENLIEPLLERLIPVMKELKERFEIVMVDDGSSDATSDQIRLMMKKYTEIKLLRLSRNFGKEIAISAGLDHACAQAVIIIDADLQHPPELIPEFVAAWRRGFDVVYGIRRSRQDESLIKKLFARSFYWLLKRTGEIPIPTDAGDFRLIDSKVAEALCSLPERNRFMKGLYAWVGFRQTGIVYDVSTRSSGQSKYNFWRLWKFALDGLTAFTTVPLKIWTYVGAIVAMSAVTYATYEIVRTLVMGKDVPGYASLIVSVLLLGGLQLISLGIIGEYMGRIFIEVKGRPQYLIAEQRGFDSDGEMRERNSKK